MPFFVGKYAPNVLLLFTTQQLKKVSNWPVNADDQPTGEGVLISPDAALQTANK